MRIPLDNGIDKVYIKKGVGWETPTIPTVCTVDIVGRVDSEDGGTFLQLQDFDINLDDLYLPQSLEVAMLSMKPEEVASFYVNYEKIGDGYLPDQHLCSIPPGSDLLYNITMKSFVCNKQHWEMDMDEKFTIAASLKESGNKLFHNNQLQRA
uniref:Peptidyl-prolyl cis-trans isomerase FKBP65 n=1 Tax=Lygus hesperus TaxID=30085 RepID=A0A0A9YYW2_LYGHE